MQEEVLANTYGYDDKGRPKPEIMTEREIAIETLTWLRSIGDQVNELASSPTLQMFKGGNPLSNMFGKNG